MDFTSMQAQFWALVFGCLIFVPGSSLDAIGSPSVKTAEATIAETTATSRVQPELLRTRTLRREIKFDPNRKTITTPTLGRTIDVANKGPLYEEELNDRAFSKISATAQPSNIAILVSASTTKLMLPKEVTTTTTTKPAVATTTTTATTISTEVEVENLIAKVNLSSSTKASLNSSASSNNDATATIEAKHRTATAVAGAAALTASAAIGGGQVTIAAELVGTETSMVREETLDRHSTNSNSSSSNKNKNKLNSNSSSSNSSNGNYSSSSNRKYVEVEKGSQSPRKSLRRSKDYRGKEDASGQVASNAQVLKMQEQPAKEALVGLDMISTAAKNNDFLTSTTTTPTTTTTTATLSVDTNLILSKTSFKENQLQTLYEPHPNFNSTYGARYQNSTAATAAVPSPATSETVTTQTTSTENTIISSTTTTSAPLVRTTKRRKAATTTIKPPPIIDDYQTITSQAGTHAYLPCNVKQLVKKPISWLRVRDGHILTVDQTTFIADQRFQAIYTPNPERWSLQIKYVQPKDAGTYECQVSTEPKASAIVTLRIVEPKTELLGEPSRHVKAGSPVKLRCIISQALEPPLFINWFYNQKQIYLHNRKGWRTEIERFELPPETPPPTRATTSTTAMDSTTIGSAEAVPREGAEAIGTKTRPSSSMSLSENDVSPTAAMSDASIVLAAVEETTAILEVISRMTTTTTTTTTAATSDIRQITAASLIIAAVEKQDSGNYTCSPSNSEPRTVVLHVLNGEYSASAITSGSSSSIIFRANSTQRSFRCFFKGFGSFKTVLLLLWLTYFWVIKKYSWCGEIILVRKERPERSAHITFYNI